MVHDCFNILLETRVIEKTYNAWCFITCEYCFLINIMRHNSKLVDTRGNVYPNNCTTSSPVTHFYLQQLFCIAISSSMTATNMFHQFYVHVFRSNWISQESNSNNVCLAYIKNSFADWKFSCCISLHKYGIMGCMQHECVTFAPHFCTG